MFDKFAYNEFVQFLKDNREKVEHAVVKTCDSIPAFFNTHEMRPLIGLAFQRCFVREFPENFQSFMGEPFDLLWNNTVKIQMKSQQFIFPRFHINNPSKMTKPKTLRIKNFLGKQGVNNAACDALIAIQSGGGIHDEEIRIGVMPYYRIIHHGRSETDAFVCSPRLSAWDLVFDTDMLRDELDVTKDESALNKMIDFYIGYRKEYA